MIRLVTLAILASFVPAIANLVDDAEETTAQLSERIRVLEKRFEILDAKFVKIAPRAADALIGPNPSQPSDVRQVEGGFKVGNKIAIIMTGELAKELKSRAYSEVQFLPGAELDALAVIIDVLENGKLLIENTTYVYPMKPIPTPGSGPKAYYPSGNPTHMITISGIIDPQLLPELPVAELRTFRVDLPDLVAELRTFRVDLPDLKEWKLRTWTLTDEVGEK